MTQRPGTTKIIKSLFTPEECEKIVAFSSTFNTKDAEVTGGKKNQYRNKKVRNCQIVWIENNDANRWIFERIEQEFHKANEELYQFDIDFLEQIQFTKYRPFNFFKAHIDNGGEKISNRKLTMSIQLTKPSKYWGGELKVHSSEGLITASKEQGDAIIFPAYLLHQAFTVYTGNRYCLVSWMRGNNNFR